MLSILCVRHHHQPPSKPWLLLSFPHEHSHFGVATSVWRNSMAPAPAASDWRRDYLLPAFLNHHHNHDQKGEGSWNVAWDARPARWLRRVDVAWLIFGVCAAAVDWIELDREANGTECGEWEKKKKKKKKGGESLENGEAKRDEDAGDGNTDYRVTGVPADGRCLFRAIVHGACLQSGEAALDDNRQRELADELRAKVVEELLKRRDEIEWFIEEDFDTYIKRIQQPFVWGGEPELLMAAHVLKTPISVYTKDKRSGILTKISDYGEEYQQDVIFPINVLFHGYGHYDILETSSNNR